MSSSCELASVSETSCQLERDGALEETAYLSSLAKAESTLTSS